MLLENSIQKVNLIMHLRSMGISSNKVLSAIERLKPLLVNAQSCFKKLKLTNIVSEVGDGFFGWPKLAPFDHIIITCAIEKLDERILNQIRFNGICIAPVGEKNGEQRLKKVILKNTRDDDIWEDLGKVSFVPLISNID